jgi:hypothetical protein
MKKRFLKNPLELRGVDVFAGEAEAPSDTGARWYAGRSEQQPS